MDYAEQPNMNNKEIMTYMLENERKRYEYAKELQKTLRWAILSVLACITIIVSMYIYFVIPAEEVVVDGESKATINTVVDNGSQVWQ